MIWDYDVMMHGTWDANEWNAINNNAVDVIGRYIDAGKGVLTGHDTMGYKMGSTYGISRLANKFNLIRAYWPGMSNSTGIEMSGNKGWAYGSRKVKINKKGFLTQFPWNLGPVRNSFKYTICTYNIKCSKRQCMDGVCRRRLLE